MFFLAVRRRQRAQCILLDKAGVLMSRRSKNMLDYQQSFNKKKEQEAEQTSG
jgi:hypothetical protein